MFDLALFFWIVVVSELGCSDQCSSIIITSIIIYTRNYIFLGTTRCAI